MVKAAGSSCRNAWCREIGSVSSRPRVHLTIKCSGGGIETIRDMGFFPVIPEQLFLKKRYLAGEDDHRAHLINRMFADNAIKAIFCARGGYGASRVLSHLDWKTICRHPKVFVGFSDVSVLLTAFYSRCGMVTFHGPVVTSLAVSDSETKAMLKAVISTPDPVVYDLRRPVAIRPGTARGTVTGGNLCTLCHLAGTAFAPEVSGSIPVFGRLRRALL